MRRIGLLAAGLAFAASAMPAQATEFVTNGSFESPFTGTAVTVVNAGQTTLTGWTVLANSIDIVGGPYPASDGVQAVDLVGSGIGGGISQLLSLAAGEYKLTFDYRNNTDNPNGNFTADVTFGSAVSSITGSSVYQTFTGFFTVDAGNTLLSFLDTSGKSNQGVFIDNVSVTESVPEAATWAMMLIGFGAIGSALRRRREANLAAATA